MTSNLRSRGGGAAHRRPLDPEERFQRRVTLGFIALIVVAVVVIVLGIVWQYWDQHLKAVATVDGTAISRDEWVDRVNLDDFRLDRADRRITEAAAAGLLTQAQADARHQDIATAQGTVTDDSLEQLIDLVLKSKLASGQGIVGTVTAAVRSSAPSPKSCAGSVRLLPPMAGT